MRKLTQRERMKKVISIEILDEYKLLLKFNNGEKRVYDMSNRLNGVFEHLKDYNEFKAVKVIDGAPTWFLNYTVPSNICREIDICPTSAYLDSVPFEGGKPLSNI